MVTTPNDLPKTALIYGAGAVENAWLPVLRALKDYVDFPLSPDGANAFLARLVYLLRWNASLDNEHGRMELKKYVEVLSDIKIKVAQELRSAEKKREIRHRPSLEILLWKHLMPITEGFFLISTNWDTVIENSIRKLLIKHFHLRINTVHIHGNVGNANRMYLPSELTKEPYRKKEDEIWLGTQHGITWRTLEKCRKVIIYGLSLDPLDAELGMVLAAGFSNTALEEILIVDPNHSVIAHRINLLLDRRRDIKVKGINCTTIEEEADYTIWRKR